MNADLAKMMSKIQGLIAKAGDAGATEAEAALFREKAEELLRKYRLTEEELIAVDPTIAEPVKHELFLYDPTQTRLGQYYSWLVGMIARHHGVRAVITYPGARERRVALVGYEGDVRATEWVYSTAVLVFMARVDPSVDPALSDEDNCYNLRSAGMLRRAVAERVFGENTPAARSRVQRLYLSACAKRGEAPRVTGTTNAKDYQEAYAEGFVAELDSRLRRASDAADSSGGALVLHGRSDRVDEALYRFFPELRPSTDPEPVDTTPKKVRKPTKADLRRATRRYYGNAAVLGREAGRDAAGDVELDRVAATARLTS